METATGIKTGETCSQEYAWLTHRYQDVSTTQTVNHIYGVQTYSVGRNTIIKPCKPCHVTDQTIHFVRTCYWETDVAMT